MNFPFYISKRYLISKKSHNIINLIAGISVTGVLVGTMALIVVLSVFNGFEKLVLSLFNTFNPDLRITATVGKTFHLSSLPYDQVKSMPGVLSITEVIEENALMRYNDRQYIVTLKGVSESFTQTSHVDTMIVEGRFLLQQGSADFAVLGYGVAWSLGTDLRDAIHPIQVYVPKRGFSGGIQMEQAFEAATIFPSAYFSVQQDFDSKYVIVPIRFTRNLLGYKDELSALEIAVVPGASREQVKASLRRLLCENYAVKDRFQQQELLYKIMQSEKWAVFLILAFILLIATFNVVGSLSILILDKRKDIAVLKSLGADNRIIRNIFLTEGIMISFAGAFLGLLLGAAICYVQQRFGLIRLGGVDSSFVVSHYPVQMEAVDFVLVFATVMAIGFAATWLPVRGMRRLTRIIPGRILDMN